ncbi:PAS domain S-box protein [Candidatus Bipolaricaulota bacterium]|nr:PAS domain S-box protein [Candidatus Bipolaricaulota bacterium]
MDCSDRNCREFIEQLPEAVFLETLRGEILDVNNEACEFLGYSKEELLGMEVSDLVPEDAPAFLPVEIDNATRSGEPLETVNVDSSGNNIPVELRGRIVELDGEKRVLISLREISERKEREKQLERYKMAVEGSDDLMAACDNKYNYLFANKSYAELYGQTKDNIVNKKVAEVVGEVTFEDVIKPRIDRCLQGERIEYETTRSHPQLGERELKTVYYPLKEEGVTHGIVGVLRDITEVKEIEKRLQEANDRLRQSRKRYKRYFDRLGDAVFITEVGGEDHGSILDANSAAEDQTGYSLNELIGMNIATDFPVGRPEEFSNEEIDKKLSEGKTVSFTEKKRRKDGSVYWTEVIVNPIEHEGNPATLSINRDITDRKKYQERLRAIEELSQKIKLTDSKDQLYDLVIGNVEETLGYGTVSICEKRDDAMKIVRIKGPYLSQSKGRELPLDGKGLIPAACRKCEPLYVEDVTEDDRYVRGTESPGSEYVIPLQIEGELYGALDFENEKKAAFDEKDRDLMDILGSQVSVALQGIERLKLYDEQRDKLRKLHQAVDRLQQKNSEQAVLETAVEAAEDMLDFEICAISLLEDDYLVPRVNSTDLAPNDTKTFKIGEGIAGKTIKNGETIWGKDLRNYAQADPTSERFRAFISVSIGKLGVLQIISENIGSFQEKDVELAEILAGHLHEELLRVRLEEDLRDQTIHDPLTGLYNRRYFNETLSKEVGRSERYGHNIAFLMIDVNSFKEINDTYSHQIGDKVLEKVAEILKENVRDADTVVRYGGDEFLIMMPETNGDSKHTVDRLRGKLSEWNEESDILDFPLTLAMGVSHWNAEQERSVEDALNEADHIMYEEKNN